MKVSKSKPLVGKPLPGNKRPGLDPAIHFHGVDGNDKYDRVE